MWENLTVTAVPFANLVVRAVVVYVFILILMRISGKREMGHMGAVEFVTVLLISNAVQNSMNAGDNSLLGGMILAATLIALSLGFSAIAYRSKLFSRVFEGTPTLLINKGKIIKANMSKERLRESEIRVLLRKQGVHHYHEVSTAILESDGTLSVTKIGDLAMDSEKEDPMDDLSLENKA
jgi:uncharacterized membrane protein YcaP (DUF421 family)